jgi:hypothetical protein
MRTPASIIKKSSSVMPLRPNCEYRKYKRRMMKHIPIASSAHASAMKLTADCCLHGGLARKETIDKDDV